MGFPVRDCKGIFYNGWFWLLAFGYQLSAFSRLPHSSRVFDEWGPTDLNFQVARYMEHKTLAIDTVRKAELRVRETA